MPQQGIAGRVAALAGWRRSVIALVAGALSVLALAPFFIWPVLFLTLPVLVWLIDGAVAPRTLLAPASGWRRHLTTPYARAPFVTWLFAFGYFFAGLFWIGEAFLVEAEKFAIFIPIAVSGMPAGLALFWAGAAALAALVWRPGFARILALALTLAIAEWLRGHVLTGFPWNVLGYVLTGHSAFMQSASLVGVYGLTLIAVPLFAAPLVLFSDRSGGSIVRRLAPAGLALIVLAVFYGWGVQRLRDSSPVFADAPRVRLVQPSIVQREKWRPENQGRIFFDHIALSLLNPLGVKDDAAGIALIVWPEAAMPFLPLSTPRALEEIGTMLPAGAHLISGALRLEEPAPGDPTGQRRIYNSLMVFGAAGALVANYDKIHLVPFGEYLPLHTLLEAIGLENLSRLRGGFEAGSEPRPLLNIPGLPKLGPLICYEAIFPRAVVQGDERPAALVNVTNDGWFGNTTGPRQHLQQARVRAVEEGLPILRAANNGISAIIDAKGRLVAQLGLDVKGTIDAALPPALPPPLYARLGDWIFAAMLLLGALLLAGLSRLRR
jgi:apolipoprotein N-acyltransferase